jgi:hypothetical protein
MTPTLIKLQSQPAQTQFAPEWCWYIYEAQIPEKDLNMMLNLKNLILAKEKEIVQKIPAGNDGYTGLGENSLTSRFERFNVFHWKTLETEYLKEQILRQYLEFLKAVKAPRRKVWIQCWANVLRNEEEIKPHLHAVHPWTYIGGHYMVSCSETSTVYINPINQLNDAETYSSKNIAGKLTLFQNNIPHYTTKHLSNKPRISIAFDIIVDERAKTYSLERQLNLVLFDNIT